MSALKTQRLTKVNSHFFLETSAVGLKFQHNLQNGLSLWSVRIFR